MGHLPAMPKEEQAHGGTVTHAFPGTMFRVELPGQRNVLAHISRKMRISRVVPGDNARAVSGTNLVAVATALREKRIVRAKRLAPR